ncbi:MAG: hypothetical protein FJW14_11585 [Acidimicrobiia bacterium]|nr:hypothetical protein [Acidimicrobiia bacterium]
MIERPRRKTAVFIARAESVQDRHLFLFAAAWVVTGGLALQLVILPYVLPFAHAGHGLVANTDGPGYYITAVALAETIQMDGFGAWWFFKDRTNDYIVAVSSLFYLITPEPWILLPLSGVQFGITVVAIRRVLAIASASAGVALASILPFFLFPSFVMIWGQPHKDLNAGLGLAVTLYALAAAGFTIRHRVTWLVGAAGAGLGILWLSRPYAVMLVAAAAVVFAVAASLSRQCRRGRLVSVVGAMLGCAALGQWVPSVAPARPEQVEVYGFISRACEPPTSRVDSVLYTVCALRQGFVYAGTEASSTSGYDYDVQLRSAMDFVRYLPRAVAVATLEPLPQRWGTERTTVGRLASLFVPIEMSAAYMCFALALLFGRRLLARPIVWAIAGFCITYSAIFAVVITQVGTLYRTRAFAFAILIATALACALSSLRPVTAGAGPLPHGRV